MTDDELIEHITAIRRRGTDLQYVEAKKVVSALPKRLWETLSAFANQPGGGVIILGLDETQQYKAVGVKDVAKVQADLASACDEMEPPLRPLIRGHDIEGVQLVVAEVPEVAPEQKPCFYKGSGLYTGSFIRVGDGDRQMTQYEVHSFLENRGQPTHDLEPVPGTTRADLDAELVQRFLQRVRTRRPRLASLGDDELLRRLHVLDAQGVVTLAGWLCFAPFPQERFPELTTTFVHYPGVQPDQLGTGGVRFLDNRRFDGLLPLAQEDALQAIVGSMRQRSLIQGLIRQEIPEYPPEAVREALVNAVGHRDYSKLARGTQVQVQMFQNRLEVQNPGGLFGPVNEDNLGEPGVQAARNQFLMQMLEDLGPAENRGSGILTMVRATRQAQMSPPELEDRRTFFRVVFPNDTMLDDATLAWLNRFAALDLNQHQRLALAYTLHQEEINNPIYRRLTGADCREATAELHDLVVRGLLEQDGSGRWTTYRLSEAAGSPEDEAGTGSAEGAADAKQRQERIHRLLAARGPLSARTVSEELQIPLRTVKADLKALTGAKRVEPTTNQPRDPRTKYRVKPAAPGGSGTTKTS